MSLLQHVVLPGTAAFRAEGDRNAVTTPARRLRKSQSHAGFLSPLVHLVRNPVGLIGDVLWSLQEEPARVSENVEVDNRRQILYLRMKEVSDP